MQQKSAFVDIVGWVSAVLAGFGVLVGVMQNIMVHVILPPDFHEQIAQNAEHVGAGFEVFRYVEVIFAATLILMLVALLSAIGLLKRRNWARVTFIVLMLLGVVWNLANLAMQMYFFNNMMPANVPTDGEFRERFDIVMSVMKWAMSGMALVFSALFGWIAWKRTRPVVRVEFNGLEARAELPGLDARTGS